MRLMSDADITSMKRRTFLKGLSAVFGQGLMPKGAAAILEPVVKTVVTAPAAMPASIRLAPGFVEEVLFAASKYRSSHSSVLHRAGIFNPL